MEFKAIFEKLRSSPTDQTFQTFATQMEMLARVQEKDVTKGDLMTFFRDFRRNAVYDQIRSSETTLRMYKLLGKVSQRMGPVKIYEQLDVEGEFNTSLQFHVQWAEEYAKTGDEVKFGQVLDLARTRFEKKMSNANIEAGFRDLADEYFNSESINRLFLDPDDTMNLFNVVGSVKKGRRRSSVTHLRQAAPIRENEEALFGPKTRTLVRPEFVETIDRHGISPEEFRLALFNDDAGHCEQVDMELEHEIQKKRKDSGILPLTRNPKEEEGRLMTKRKKLSTLNEEKSTMLEEMNEKRSRIYSPAVKTSDAERVPLRNSSMFNEKAPPTITLSSDTRVSTLADDASFESKDISGYDEQKLMAMREGRGSMSSTRTSKSNNDGLALMAENNCLEAHAMFSDTVHLARDKTINLETDTYEESHHVIYPSAKPNTAPEYSILCDPDPTMVQEAAPKSASAPKANKLNIIYDEDAKIDEKKDQPAPASSLPTPIMFDIKETVTPPTMHHHHQHEEHNFDFFDDDFATSFRPHAVTSTPAVGVPFVRVEEYFGVEKKEEEPEVEPSSKRDGMFVIPNSPSVTKQTNRKSLMLPSHRAPQPQAAPSALSHQSHNIVAATKPAAKNDESLSEQLGRRLSLGGDVEMPEQHEQPEQKQQQDMFEETGRKDRRRSEMIKGDLNPWDVELRKKVMALVRPPTNMHEFPSKSIKVVAMKQVEVGGERYDIRTVLGQGGYAKVYKAINEEGQVVAMKCETPPCAWEVYICDQLRNRLSKKGEEEAMKLANQCVMQVIDAYIFTNSSLLVNEYHEFGTLLDNVNNNKDPNWQILCYIIHQMATILREVHSTQIIHGDIKPDNFMITRKIDLSWQKEELLSSKTYCIKLIDFGRAIDMMTIPGVTFKGRAGTESFDCPEMIDGRPWSYQADYFGFAASISLLTSGKYPSLKGSKVGEYALDVDIKRRNSLRDAILKTIDKFLNIESSHDLPGWDETIEDCERVWQTAFDVTAWRQAAAKFNEACEKARL